VFADLNQYELGYYALRRTEYDLYPDGWTEALVKLTALRIMSTRRQQQTTALIGRFPSLPRHFREIRWRMACSRSACLYVDWVDERRNYHGRHPGEADAAGHRRRDWNGRWICPALCASITQAVGCVAAFGF